MEMNGKSKPNNFAVANSSFVTDDGEELQDDVFVDDISEEVDPTGTKDKMTRKKFLVVLCILLTEMCERLTFYSVVANMALYGTSVLKYSSTTSADMTNIFSGKIV